MSVKEALEQRDTPLNAALEAGIDQVSYDGTVDFVRYVRLVLPLDGSVFWVRGDIVNPSQVPKAAQGKPTITIKGSFHYGTDRSQDEAETFATNRMIFTSEEEVVDLNEIDPAEMYIGEIDGIKFAFSARGSFYKVADIFHYVGHAVFSVMFTQIIDNPADIDIENVIVSNSLPIWLSMNGYQPVDGEYFSLPKGLTLYPSFLSPENETPAYGTVHISTTAALASAPNLDSRLSHSQLMKDTIRITLYGVRNADAMTFVDFVNQFSVNTDLIGMMNMPAMRDDKRNQVEFAILAQRKTIDYEVSYYQKAARNIARQLIEHILVNYFIGSVPPSITSNGGGSTATVAVTHPATAVTVVVASSMAAVNFSISGANADLFRIDPVTGALVFVAPSIVGSYVVVVQAGSLYGVATQTITVNVS